MTGRDIPEMVSVAEVARRWGTSRVKVRQMCRERTHPFMWSQGHTFFIVRAGFEKCMAGEKIEPEIDAQRILFLHRRRS